MSDFIKKKKEEYKRLKSCHCPVLDEIVYFNSIGFDHLLNKRERPRPIKEVYSRLHLLKHVKTVIGKSSKTGVRRIGKLLQNSLEYRVDSNIIKVIVEKKDGGRYIFLSVMKKRLKNKKPRIN